MTKPNWYAEKWTDTENTELADSKNNGAAASRITRAGFYINYCGDDFKGLGVRAKNSSGSWEDTVKLAKFTEKFPFVQPIRGDGFCGLHSVIVGTLAKCVDDPYHFKQFKDNLTKWPDNLPADKKAKAQATINKVLDKIPQENLSYQEFYALVNQRSNTDNISKQLSVALYLNADLTDFVEDLDMQNSAKSNGIAEVTAVTAAAVTKILGPISPFGIIALNNSTYSIDKILDEELEENSVYIVGYDGHFDLLHSKLDYNLDKEIAKIELDVAKAAGVNTTEKNKALTAASQRKEESEKIEVYKKKVDDIWNRLAIQDQKTLEALGFGKYEKTEDPSTAFLSSLTSKGAELFPKLLNTRTMVEDAIKRITYNDSKKARSKTKYTTDEGESDDAFEAGSTFQSIKAQLIQISGDAEIDKTTISSIEQLAKSTHLILKKDEIEYTPLEAAKERITEAEKESADLARKIKRGEIKLVGPKKVKSKIKKEKIIEYSAKGILSKALRANAIEERAKTTAGQQENLVSGITFATIKEDYTEAPDNSGNLEIQFGRRYVRKEFVGDATTKLKFENENFGDNSFANCTFTNCDFTENSGKRLNFVNCTFGEGCVLPENLRNKDNNFVGCKFNEKIFEVMTNADELKTKLGIQTDAVAKDDFYQSEKPSSSISYGTAFKLNLQMLNSLTTTK